MQGALEFYFKKITPKSVPILPYAIPAAYLP